MAENYDEMTDRMVESSTDLEKLDRFENDVDFYGSSPDAADAMEVLRQIASRSKLQLPESAFVSRDALKQAIANKRDTFNRVIVGKVAEQQKRDVDEVMKPQEERLHDDLPPNVTDAKK